MSETSTPIRSVLVVDDDEMSLRLHMDLLEAQGMKVTATARADEALRSMGQKHFDLLVTDLRVQAPNDGLMLCSAFRRLHPDSPTLLVTGSADLTDSIEQFQKEIGALHLKGDPSSDMLKKVSGLLDSYSRRFETQSLTCILRHNREAIVEAWLQRVESDPVVTQVALSRKERMNDMHAVMDGIFLYMEQPSDQVREATRTAAAGHGRDRRAQGYTLTSFILELCHLRSAIDEQIRAHVLRVEAQLLWKEIRSLNESIADNIIGTIEGWEGGAQTAPLTKAG